MECLALRYIGKGHVCVELPSTGAVVSLRLPATVDRDAVERIQRACVFRPVRIRVELGEYVTDKAYFECTELVVVDTSATDGIATTRYKRVSV